MSSSFFAQRATLLNAIAITLVLSIISGYLPVKGPSQQEWQSALPLNWHLSR